jgi:hypothetical protein
MPRFGDAKMLGASDVKFQHFYNMLIDLLDTGYVTEAIINGKKIKVSINPKDGIVVTVDSVKVFGVDSSGNVYVQRISNTTDNSYYAEFGYGDSAGMALYMPDGVGGSIRFVNIAPTVDGGVTFVDKDDNSRMQILTDGGFTIWDTNDKLRLNVAGDGSIYMYDTSDNMVFWASDASNFCQIHAASTVDNAIGVDETGAYIIVAGAKSYLSAVFAPITPVGGSAYCTVEQAIAYAIALG